MELNFSPAYWMYILHCSQLATQLTLPASFGAKGRKPHLQTCRLVCPWNSPPTPHALETRGLSRDSTSSFEPCSSSLSNKVLPTPCIVSAANFVVFSFLDFELVNILSNDDPWSELQTAVDLGFSLTLTLRQKYCLYCIIVQRSYTTSDLITKVTTILLSQIQ